MAPNFAAVKTTYRMIAIVVVGATAALGAAAGADARPAVTDAYDALHYDVSLEYRSGSKDMAGTTTLKARATGALPRFALDFGGGRVSQVTVNGRPARFQASGERLLVTPKPLARGAEFSVTVDYVVTRSNGPDNRGPWREIDDGFAISPQNHQTMHHVYPCKNDIADKATYTISVTAPAHLTGVANGDLTQTRQLPGGRTARTYRMVHPMPAHDGQIAVGPYSLITRPGPDGVTIRDVVPTAQADQLEKTLARTDDQLRWQTARLGAYPFGTYGIFAPLGTISPFESQTMTTIAASTLASDPADYLRTHELNHQWFGASVTPVNLDDDWTAEGHAHFYGTWYDSELSQPGSPDAFAAGMRFNYEMDQENRDREGAPARPKPVSGQTQRVGGALALYALRQTVGAQTFERIERTVVSRFKDGVMSTADYITVANQVSGRDVSGLLKDWLYGTKTPPMPGHPDWKPGTPAS